MKGETLMISEQTLEANKSQPVETLKVIPLSHGDSKRQVHVGSQLEGPEKEEVVNCLRSYADIFAWTSTGMLGISLEVISHQLNIHPKA